MKRKDCCDGCRKSRDCTKISRRCWPEKDAKVEKCLTGTDCQQCFEFEDHTGINPCFEHMDLEQQRRLIRTERGLA